MLSGTASGAALGAALGALGGIVPTEWRIVAATLVAVPGLALGAFELSGRRVSPLQCDRETPQRWLHRGPLWWASRNGFALGLGVSTRIGFTLWYVIPTAALLVGNALAGAVLYWLYAFTRTVGAYLFLRADRHRGGFEARSDAMYEHAGVARTICAALLLVVTGATLAGAGL